MRSMLRSCTMVQSDMSGFTRLTSKYGIEHFLRLVFQCRKIFGHHTERFGGSILKYDGDNIVGLYPDPECCMQSIRLIREVRVMGRLVPPPGGQFDSVWLSARTMHPHVGPQYVWCLTA